MAEVPNLDVHGYHLMLDGHGDPKGWSAAKLLRLMRALVRLTGLTPIVGPSTLEANPQLIVGFCVIAESHVSAHLDKSTGNVWIDVFSCRPFPYTGVEALVRRRLRLDRLRVRFPERGAVA